MKVIGYARVSTDEQASHGHSLAAQEAKLRAYAGLYELELVQVVVDAGQSAKTLKRPGLQQVLSALRACHAEGILVAKLDRLTRSVRDLGILLDDYFAKGVSLLAVAEQVDTRSATGRMMLNLMTTMAQWEREVIGERTSAALQHLKRTGRRLGQTVLEASDQGARAAARARALRAEGRTLRCIATALHAEGYPTKRGGVWAPEQVRLLLSRA